MFVGNLTLNSYAYADDVTVFSLTASGLQKLIDICYDYSKKWRFNFGIKKTKCMIVGKSIIQREPEWYLGHSQILVDNKLEILGTVFSCDGKYNEHINSRIRKCRNSY